MWIKKQLITICSRRRGNNRLLVSTLALHRAPEHGRSAWNKMIKIIKTLLLIFIISFPSASRAENLFSDCPDLYQIGRSCFDEIKNPRSGTLPQQHRTIMDFVLGRDSFNNAQKQFGETEKWHTGDASTSEDKICYFYRSGTEQMSMVFSSNSEMSMGAVDAIFLLQGNVAFLDKCRKINITSKKLQTKSGLYVGMPIKKMKGLLGRPTEEKKELIIYSYCDEKELRPKDPLYSSCKVDDKSTAQRCSGITAGVSHGLVQWLVIWFGADYTC